MTTQVNIRIQASTKKAASKALADIGLDMSSAVNIFLRQVIVDKGLPFTPSKNPVAIRAKWDREVARALKKGKRYSSAEEMLKDML